jgi:hypothetical protein
MSVAALADHAARAVPRVRAVPLDEQEPIRADWRRILEPTRNWYYPGSDTELNLGAAQVQMHNDALQPRHHHAMDQIRYVTAGSMIYGRNQRAEAGDLVYFPESVPYGPVQYSEGHMFVLQWPGSSVNGRFIAIHEMQLAAKEIVKGGGKFDQAKGGVFVHPDGRVQEGYEAIAEFMNGGPLTYSPPRFDNQVHIKSSAIEAMPVKGAAGVSIKHLGFFTERGPNVSSCSSRQAQSFRSRPLRASKCGMSSRARLPTMAPNMEVAPCSTSPQAQYEGRSGRTRTLRSSSCT